MANDLSGGLSFRFARVSASFLESLVMWRKCSLKSNIGLMGNPSIFNDMFDWRYLMCVPSAHVMELICSCSVVWFDLSPKLSSSQSDLVASHLEVSS